MGKPSWYVTAPRLTHPPTFEGR